MNPDDPFYRNADDLLKEIYKGRGSQGLEKCDFYLIVPNGSIDEFKQLGESLKTYISETTRSHIWHVCGPQIRWDGSGVQGTLVFGDNIEDEWLLVAILLQFSESFENVYIKAEDSDGEFLLVEAAEALPQGLDENNSANRVWINKGQTRLIFPANDSEHSRSRSLSRQEALRLISDAENHDEISNIIRQKAGNISLRVANNCHWTTVAIPRKVATLLALHPQSISAAAHGLYLRDETLQKSTDTPTTFEATDLVRTSIKMTKTIFAQLEMQPFQIPSGWDSSSMKSCNDREVLLGAKVTCGLEFMVRAGFPRETGGFLKTALTTMSEKPFLSDEQISARGYRCDSDDFLNVNYEDFDDMLEQTANFSNKGTSTDQNTSDYGAGRSPKQTAKPKSPEERLKTMMQGIESFIEGRSAQVGAWDENNSGDPDDGLLSDGTDASESDVSVDGEHIGFDPNEFLRMLDQRQAAPEDVGSEQSDESELEQTMAAMDTELESTEARKFFRAENNVHHGEISHDSDGDQLPERQGSIDIDYNLARNIIGGLREDPAFGIKGPAAGLLRDMGLMMPHITDETEGEERQS